MVKHGVSLRLVDLLPNVFLGCLRFVTSSGRVTELREAQRTQKETVVFCDITPCSLYVNRRFGGTFNLHLQRQESTDQETNVQQLAKQYSA
jgi:hypothetical protein